MIRRAAVRTATKPKVDLDSMLRRQRNLLTRQQALAAGLDDETIRRALMEGHWQRLLPGLYATFTGAVTLEQRRLSAALYLRTEMQITGMAALIWHGFRQLHQDDVLHVLVPHASRRASRGFLRVQRTHRLDPTPHQGNGYVVCTVARAVADASRLLEELRPVRAIVAESVQRRLTTVDALKRELELAATSRTRLLRRAIGEVDGGLRSAPEIEFRDLLEQSLVAGKVRWNPTLLDENNRRLPCPDGWIDEVGIALEIDSREYHLGPEEWQITMRRHNALSAHGALVLHFTPSEVRGRPSHVRGVVEQAYQERQAQAARARVLLASPVTEEGSPLPVWSGSGEPSSERAPKRGTLLNKKGNPPPAKNHERRSAAGEAV